MATRWSDPPIVLMALIPLGLSVPILSILLPYKTGVWYFFFLPTIVAYLVWNFWYHAPEAADTEKYVEFKDSSLKSTWSKQKIPMCELYEFFIEDKINFKGDTYEVRNALLQ
jgi:hypothetical protein